MPVREESGGLFPRMVSFLLRKTGRGRPFSLPDSVTGSARMLFIDSGETTDLLFAAPLVNWFHERFPGIKTTLLVSAGDSEAAKSIMKVNTIITYQSGQMRLFRTDYYALIRKLRKRYYETAVLLGSSPSFERDLLAFACGAAARIGFHHQLAFPFINCEIRASSGSYAGDRVLRIPDALGLRAGTVSREISMPASEVNQAGQLIHFRKPEKDVLTVGVDPGRSKSRHSVIPETIAYLVNSLAGRKRVRFLVLTDPWDERLVSKLKSELKTDVIDLVPSGQKETLALLSKCDLFISGNTNLFHFAAALKVPVIGLFTRYDDESWVPDHAPNVRIFKGTRGEKLSMQGFFSKVEEVLHYGESVTV